MLLSARLRIELRSLRNHIGLSITDPRHSSPGVCLRCDGDKHNTVSAASGCATPLIKFSQIFFSFLQFLHFSFSTTCLKLCSSTPSCFSLFILFLSVLSQQSSLCFSSGCPRLLFSSLSSYLWSIDCFEYVLTNTS